MTFKMNLSFLFSFSEDQCIFLSLQNGNHYNNFKMIKFIGGMIFIFVHISEERSHFAYFQLKSHIVYKKKIYKG